MPEKTPEIRETPSIFPLRKVAITHAVTGGLDAIFYEASGTQVFATPQARSAFRERWLGSYLGRCSNNIFIAFDGTGNVAGYVVGALDDPAKNSEYAELGYFQDFAHWTALYPAHLHINVASQHRSMGLGARLVEAFANHAAAAGCPGVHVVTGAGLRNVGFYLRNGFEALAEAPWNGKTVVMLGRKL